MYMIAIYLALTGPAWWANTGARVGLVLAVTLIFAALGHVVHGVTRSGAIAGGILCFALFASTGPGAFLALLVLFLLTWIATRLGRSRKRHLGTAERYDGRNASQVLANLGIAAVCAVAHTVRQNPVWLLGMAAALAEAASDTVSSEIGQTLSERARLITTFEAVPAGTDGGITFAGTLAGIGAALIVSAVCMWTGILPLRWMWIAASAGSVGMLLDSVLGAVFERRGWLNNDMVNLAGTMIAVGVAAVCFRA
jgi:uncharacterized protein (TIGR00297 family)